MVFIPVGNIVAQKLRTRIILIANSMLYLYLIGKYNNFIIILLIIDTLIFCQKEPNSGKYGFFLCISESAWLARAIIRPLSINLNTIYYSVENHP